MKSNTSLKDSVNKVVPGSMLGLRHWTAAAIIMLLLPAAGIVRAQVTNVIYQDNFARAGQLSGSVPDTVDATGARWIAWNQNNLMVTDGSEVACTNTLAPAPPYTTTVVGGPPYNNAFLPITIERGHVYTITASLLANTNYANNWMALGFSISPTLVNAFNNANVGCGWLLHRSTNVVGSANGTSGNFQTFAGPGTGGSGTFNFPDLTFTTNFTTYSIVLNTATNPAGWSVTFFTNGGFVTTTTYGSPGFPKGNFDVCQGYVGFEANATKGYFRNFSVTDVVPVPVAPFITEEPQDVTGHVGQTATFWVNAVSTPDPSYQWMSNGVAIAGATNATYTTPVLGMGYNGVSYSVGITNAAGGLVGGPANLTVVAGQPTVFSATKATSGAGIVVMFSGPVDPVTALNTANYSLNNGASVLSASYGSAQSNSVVLATTTLNPNLGYDVAVQNVQDQFGESMIASTTAVLPAGMVLYLRGDSGVIQDASSLVVEWLDQTTNGNNAVQYFGEKMPNTALPGPIARPSVSTMIPNNLPVVSFNNTITNFLTAAASPSLAINTNMTIVVLANPPVFSVALDLVNKTIGNLPGSYDYQLTSGTGLGSLQSGVAGSGNAGFGGSAKPSVAGYPHEWVVTRAVTGTNVAATNAAYGSVNNLVTHYVDGVFAGSNNVTIGAPGCYDAAYQPVYIGGRQDHYSGAMMNGPIAELMLFNTALSAADLTNIDNYLGAKWFTPAFTTAPPSPLVTSNGFALTLSPGPSYGCVHGLTYQWQENGTNIPGATNTSFTTSLLAPSDNNDTFSLIMFVPTTGLTYTNATTLDVLTNAPYIAWAGIPLWNTTNQIVVLFDEPVDPVTATAITNYSLNNSVSILSASIGTAPNQVVLTTTPLTWTANPGNYTLAVANVMDLYGFAMAPATLPLGLYPPNVALWLKANAGVVTDSGANTVNEWDDQSGNGNNFYQGGGVGWEPSLATNAWGDTVVRFTFPSGTPGTTNYMAAPVSTLGILGDMSVVAAVNFKTLPGEIFTKTGATSSTRNVPAPFDYLVSGTAQFLRGNGGTLGNGTSYGNFLSTTAPWTGYPCIMAVSEQGNTVSHYLSGTAVGTGPLSNGYQEANDGDAGKAVQIGQRSDGSFPLNGDMAELIVTTSPVPSNDMPALNNYLSTQHHFGLFNGNPTKVGVSFVTNQMTISWPADHTGWQLQSNSVGLTATGAWYTVGGSTLTNQISIKPSAGQTNVFYRIFYQQP